MLYDICWVFHFDVDFSKPKNADFWQTLLPTITGDPVLDFWRNLQKSGTGFVFTQNEGKFPTPGSPKVHFLPPRINMDTKPRGSENVSLLSNMAIFGIYLATSGGCTLVRDYFNGVFDFQVAMFSKTPSDWQFQLRKLLVLNTVVWSQKAGSKHHGSLADHFGRLLVSKDTVDGSETLYHLNMDETLYR